MRQREGDMQHVLDNESHMLRQAVIAHRLDTIDRWRKILTVTARWRAAWGGIFLSDLNGGSSPDIEVT